MFTYLVFLKNKYPNTKSEIVTSCPLPTLGNCHQPISNSKGSEDSEMLYLLQTMMGEFEYDINMWYE